MQAKKLQNDVRRASSTIDNNLFPGFTALEQDSIQYDKLSFSNVQWIAKLNSKRKKVQNIIHHSKILE